MKTIEQVAQVAISIALIGAGWVAHAAFFPQNPVVETEVEVFVDRVIKIPSEKEDYYNECQHASSKSYLSSWNGDLKEGVSPKDIENFIQQCLNYFNN